MTQTITCQKLPMQIIDGHLLVEVPTTENTTLLAILDSGCPISFGKESLMINGNVHHMPSSMGPMSPEDATREFIDVEITAFIGCDILDQYDIQIDMDEMTMAFSTEYLSFTESAHELRASNIHSHNVILNIAGSSKKMLFDTGAHISYAFDPNIFDHGESAGTHKDYNPMFGHFTTDTFRLETDFGENRQELVFGNNLPKMFKNMIMFMGKAEGVIGSEPIIKSRQTKISFRQEKLQFN